MSLINCPECNRQVSDQANSCPNCGFQIANYFNQKERELKQIEQQEKLNKKIAEQEKRKQLWINRFKKHKKKIYSNFIYWFSFCYCSNCWFNAIIQ